MAAKLIIIGHRGAAGLAEENSLEGIRQSIKHNVDMIELDLRVKDSVVILSHDKPSSNIVYCPLKQALSEVNGKVPLNLEVKQKSVVKKLPKLLEKYTGEIVFSSSSYSTLKEIREVLPQYEIAIIEKWSSLRAVAESVLLNTKQR